MDLPSGENKKEEYLKINPKGTVPAMVVGDEKICESSDIAKKLVHMAPQKALYPAENTEKIDEILNWVQTDLYPACGGISVSVKWYFEVRDANLIFEKEIFRQLKKLENDIHVQICP